MNILELRWLCTTGPTFFRGVQSDNAMTVAHLSYMGYQNSNSLDSSKPDHFVDRLVLSCDLHFSHPRITSVVCLDQGEWGPFTLTSPNFYMLEMGNLM